MGPILPLITPDSPLVKLLAEKARERHQIYAGAERGMNPDEPVEFDGPQLAYLLNTAFWASLRQEEGRPARGAMTVADRTVPGGLRFTEPVLVTQESLVRLSPALGASLAAVELSPDGMPQIWGLLEAPPLWQPVIRIVGPATLVISEDRQVIGLQRGATTHIVRSGPQSLMTLLSTVLDRTQGASLADGLARADHLVRVIASLHRTGHDGMILVVPAESAAWRDAIHLRYAFDPHSSALPPSRLADLPHSRPEPATRAPGPAPSTTGPRAALRPRPQTLLADLSQRLLAQIGRLAAADGAVVVGADLSLYGFGAEVSIPATPGTLSAVDAVSGAIETDLPLTAFGPGLAAQAARFVRRYPECIAIAASAGGNVTVFAWPQDDRPLTALKHVQDLLVEY
jgi:hypothetical protein